MVNFIQNSCYFLSILSASLTCQLAGNAIDHYENKVQISPNVAYSWCEELFEEMFNTPQNSILCMLKVKKVVENSIGNKISMENALYDMNLRLKSIGQGFTKKEMDIIRSEIQRHTLPEIYNEMFQFSDQVTAQELIDKINEKDQYDPNKRTELPIKISVGISLVLSGGFLCYLPHPHAKKTGAVFIGYGVDLIKDGFFDHHEEKQKKVKDIRFERNDDPDVIDIRQKPLGR